MKNNTNTNTNGAKILFIDFMKLSITERKAHIERYSPNMLEQVKQAVLH